MPDITVNDTRLHYDEEGAGAPILCIHGTGSSALVWAPAIAALARLGRVISYDRRGYTRSERAAPEARCTVGEHADDAAALLAALGAAPAIIIGRSYGGVVALDLALRHPGAVRALVLLEGALLSLDDEARRWGEALLDRILTAGGRDPAAAAETLMDAVLGDGGFAALPAPLRDLIRDNGPAILAESRGDELVAVPPAALADLDVPTLVVVGADSPPPLQRANERAAAMIPGARLAHVPGGHLIDPAAPPVLAFLGELLRPATAAAEAR